MMKIQVTATATTTNSAIKAPIGGPWRGPLASFCSGIKRSTSSDVPIRGWRTQNRHDLPTSLAAITTCGPAHWRRKVSGVLKREALPAGPGLECAAVRPPGWSVAV